MYSTVGVCAYVCFKKMNNLLQLPVDPAPQIKALMRFPEAVVNRIACLKNCLHTPDQYLLQLLEQTVK